MARHGDLVGGLAPDQTGVLQAEVGDDQLGAKAEKVGPVGELLQLRDVGVVEGPEISDLPHTGGHLAPKLCPRPWIVLAV